MIIILRNLIILAFAIIIPILGCSKTPTPNPQPADTMKTVQSSPAPSSVADTSKTEYRVLATVTAVDEKNSTLTIDHEKIEGYMAAMEMPYKVGDPSIFQKVRIGTKGHFTITVTNGDGVITNVHVHKK